MPHPLTQIIQKLQDDTGLTALIGAEVEFCLSLPDENDTDCLALVMALCRKTGLSLHGMEKETAHGQYEISLSPADPQTAAQHIITLRETISHAAQLSGGTADFSPKPDENQPGNGLHIHISLHDREGQNQFPKPNPDNGAESPLLLWSIGGLCATMAEAMIFFAPEEKSYTRFTAERNAVAEGADPLQCYNNAPTHISWGGNNRTTAIRIPTSTLHPDQRHIEHRVAGADANPEDVIAAILAGIHYGITQQLPAPEKIYGNAFDPQYKLPLLPSSLEEAQHVYESGKLLKSYIFPS